MEEVEELYKKTFKIDEIDSERFCLCFGMLTWFYKNLLELCSKNSLRGLEKKTNIKYYIINYHKHKALKKIKYLYQDKIYTNYLNQD